MSQKNNTTPHNSAENIQEITTDFDSQAQLTQNKTVPFAVVEAYKAIRTNLMFMLPQKGSK